MPRCRVNFYFLLFLNKGIVKVVATALFLCFGVETLGRKISFFISAMGMGTLFYIIGAVLKTHPPTLPNANIAGPSPSPASKAMAAMLYIYVCFYSIGCGNGTSSHRDRRKLPHYSRYAGPLPWVYVSDIFPTRTRHYGLAFASASQWLWSTFQYRFCLNNPLQREPTDFVVSKVTPNLYTLLGYKLFLTFATINIGGMGMFALYDLPTYYTSKIVSSPPINIDSSQKPKAVVWKRWMSSLDRSPPSNVRLTSISARKVTLFSKL